MYSEIISFDIITKEDNLTARKSEYSATYTHDAQTQTQVSLKENKKEIIMLFQRKYISCFVKHAFGMHQLFTLCQTRIAIISVSTWTVLLAAITKYSQLR